MSVEVRQKQTTPLWRDATVIKWTVQLVVLVLLLGFFYRLASTAAGNISDRGITFGWRWLADPVGFQIREGIDTLPDSGIRAILTGMVNMLRVTVAGIIVATILGTLIGIARLSTNWIVNKIGTVYVEIIRNIPLLVQIFFWQAMIIALDPLVEKDVGTYFMKWSAKGITLPRLAPSVGFWQWLVFLVLGLFVARYVARWRHRVQDDTGQLARSFTYGFGVFTLFAIVGWFVHPVLGFMSHLWGGLEAFFRGIPAPLYAYAIALGILLGVAWWIRSFFESRRTPAGFGKFSDDDIFRLAFAALAGIGLALVVIWLGSAEFAMPRGSRIEGSASLAEVIRLGVGNIFNFLENKFHGLSGNPLSFALGGVEVRGAGFIQYSEVGTVITAPFFATFMGVTVYTAAFIAEIVRAGILAVPKGQTEAAGALGLKRMQYLRLVILPQAFRIILPPMGNQYLNLAKNTSLGIAVAYGEIVAVGFTISNQTGQTLPIVLTWMAFFLTVSLSLSAIVNYYNRKLQLVER